MSNEIFNEDILIPNRIKYENPNLFNSLLLELNKLEQNKYTNKINKNKYTYSENNKIFKGETAQNVNISRKLKTLNLKLLAIVIIYLEENDIEDLDKDMVLQFTKKYYEKTKDENKLFASFIRYYKLYIKFIVQ
jgi:hypothetical protein